MTVLPLEVTSKADLRKVSKRSGWKKDTRRKSSPRLSQKKSSTNVLSTYGQSSDGKRRSSEYKRSSTLVKDDLGSLKEEKKTHVSIRDQLVNIAVLSVCFVGICTIYSIAESPKVTVNKLYEPGSLETINDLITLISDDFHCSLSSIDYGDVLIQEEAEGMLMKLSLCLQAIGQMPQVRMVAGGILHGYINSSNNFQEKGPFGIVDLTMNNSFLISLKTLLQQRGSQRDLQFVFDNVRSQLPNFPYRPINGMLKPMEPFLKEIMDNLPLPNSTLTGDGISTVFYQDDMNWKWGQIDYVTTGFRSLGPLAVAIIQTALQKIGNMERKVRDPHEIDKIVNEATSAALQLYPLTKDWTHSGNQSIVDMVPDILKRMGKPWPTHVRRSHGPQMNVSHRTTSMIMADMRTGWPVLAAFVVSASEKSDRLFRNDTGEAFLNAAPMIIQINNKPVYLLSSSGTYRVLDNVVSTAVHCIVTGGTPEEAIHRQGSRKYFDLRSGTVKDGHEESSDGPAQAVHFTEWDEQLVMVSIIQKMSSFGYNTPIGI